jgi:hypothetical protein
MAAVLLAALGVASAQGPASASRPGGMHGWRADRDNTPGWRLMTGQERAVHQQKMRAMQSAEECKAYMDQHRAQMVERAKQRGRAAPPAQPRQDPCARLKP